MKKQFIRACSWAVALLLGSIAGGCSPAASAARSAEKERKEAAEQRDTVVSPEPEKQVEPKVVDIPDDGHRVRVLYGVRVVDFEVKE